MDPAQVMNVYVPVCWPLIRIWNFFGSSDRLAIGVSMILYPNGIMKSSDIDSSRTAYIVALYIIYKDKTCVVQ